jgi:hypothetical protein
MLDTGGRPSKYPRQIFHDYPLFQWEFLDPKMDVR